MKKPGDKSPLAWEAGCLVWEVAVLRVGNLGLTRRPKRIVIRGPCGGRAQASSTRLLHGKLQSSQGKTRSESSRLEKPKYYAIPTERL
mmetsp:Transcript_26400/g.42308  ORF Transcript_26400/g.42308 Transcript_26400/m.42308 type:complete len:88 (+) Transcript_26400:421-684(+)